MYLLVTIHVPVSLPIPVFVPVHVFVPGYLGRWTEEAGCQTRGILKRRVVRPVSNFSLGEIIVGS
jgi:hypothetical protein